jgi:hypothetical protein
MIGKRSAQMPLFEVGNVFDLKLAPESFHSQLANAAPRLFADQDFANVYNDKLGRPSVAPSLLALTLLLQHEAGVSDEEAIERTAYDLRWAAVLRKEAGHPLCAKSTLQLFRAQLVVHPEVQSIFVSSIKEAKRAGLLKGSALRIAVDTKPIRGRGAVQDTFNLLATRIRQLARAIAGIQEDKLDDYLNQQDLHRYSSASLKGSADIDWSDEAAKEALLTQVVTDAKRLLVLAPLCDPEVGKAAQLLQQLLLQDVTLTPTSEGSEKAQVTQGTVKGRIPSATDPDIRHGRKSASKRFNGHKGSIAVDEDSQIIVGLEILSGDAGDATDVLALVEQVEENTALAVSETTGDCAYGGGPTRAAFAEADRDLLAKVPQEASRNGLFAKSAFDIDVENDRVSCPAGQVTTTFSTTPEGGKTFLFGSVCAECPLRALCTTSKTGRSVSVHPQEAMLQSARAYQRTPEGRARLRERVVVEHRLARLSQLGISQARYVSRKKTRFQLAMACALANFRWVWNWEARQRLITNMDSAQNRLSEPLAASFMGRICVCFGLLVSLRSILVLRACAGMSLRRSWTFAEGLVA